VSDELETRVRDLQAVAAEFMPGESPITARFAWVVCDRCGLRVDLGDPPDFERVEGWTRVANLDFCEGCS
jgi:hypothetical protein